MSFQRSMGVEEAEARKEPTKTIPELDKQRIANARHALANARTFAAVENRQILRQQIEAAIEDLDNLGCR